MVERSLSLNPCWAIYCCIRPVYTSLIQKYNHVLASRFNNDARSFSNLRFSYMRGSSSILRKYLCSNPITVSIDSWVLLCQYPPMLMQHKTHVYTNERCSRGWVDPGMSGYQFSNLTSSLAPNVFPPLFIVVVLVTSLQNFFLMSISLQSRTFSNTRLNLCISSHANSSL